MQYYSSTKSLLKIKPNMQEFAKIARKLIFLCVLSTASNIFSAPTIDAIGARQCSDWIQVRKEGGWASINSESWLVGYLSGMASATGRDVLTGVDAKAIHIWADNYCQQNPLDNTTHVGVKLFYELSRRKIK